MSSVSSYDENQAHLFGALLSKQVVEPAPVSEIWFGGLGTTSCQLREALLWACLTLCAGDSSQCHGRLELR